MASMMDIRRSILMNAVEIPPIYQAYDYLQTTGGKARIDTGIAGNDTTIQIAGDIKEMTFGAYNAFLGNNVGDSYLCWRALQPNANTSSYVVFNVYRDSAISVSAPSGTWQNVPVRFQFLLKHSYAEVTLNGVTTSKTSSSGSDSKPTNNANIGIGSRSVTANSGTATHRIYSVKIWRQGSLVRDYRPCIRVSDNVAGFYDVVNSTFNPSTGTEAFIAGND